MLIRVTIFINYLWPTSQRKINHTSESIHAILLKNFTVMTLGGLASNKKQVLKIMSFTHKYFGRQNHAKKYIRGIRMKLFKTLSFKLSRLSRITPASLLLILFKLWYSEKFCSGYNILIFSLIFSFKGELPWSEDMEILGDSLVSDGVPRVWASKAYPSLLPLGSWFTDLIQRYRCK